MTNLVTMVKSSMRYEKADNLLQLALELQAARGGLSLADIEEKFGVGRRTAMRMRDAVLRNFPRRRRWKQMTGPNAGGYRQARWIGLSRLLQKNWRL